MTSLLLTETEATEENGPMMDKPKYPYGTCLYLDKITLEKLGMTELPTVGNEMTITGKVIVVGTSERQNLEGEKYQSVDLQITDMVLGAQAETRTNLDRANMLYGDAE